MGKSLMDAVKNSEAGVPEEGKKPASGFKSNFEKNKMVSAYVDRERYAMFTEINKLRGISNNKQLNVLISDYILEHRKLLEG